MIWVRLGKNKVFILQLINKFYINLAVVNILIYPTIGRILYAVWGLYKVDISYGIAYKAAAVKYFLITNILVKVHVIIWYNKLSSLYYF